jgi:hypothetical protein
VACENLNNISKAHKIIDVFGGNVLRKEEENEDDWDEDDDDDWGDEWSDEEDWEEW